MDTEGLIQQVISAWNSGDKEAYMALFSDDAEITYRGGRVVCGRDAIGLDFDTSHRAFPGARITVNNVISGGDQACVEAFCESAQTGPLGLGGMQIPATDRRVSFSFVEMNTIKDDKIVTVRSYCDQLDLLDQLGMSAPESMSS